MNKFKFIIFLILLSNFFHIDSDSLSYLHIANAEDKYSEIFYTELNYSTNRTIAYSNFKISKIEKRINIKHLTIIKYFYRHYYRQKEYVYWQKFNTVLKNFICKKYFSIFNRTFYKISDLVIINKTLLE